MSQKDNLSHATIVTLPTAHSRNNDSLHQETQRALKQDNVRIAENTWGNQHDHPASDGVSQLDGSWLKLLSEKSFREFKPCVVYYEGIKATEMLLENCDTVWCPWGPTGHAVDLGYSDDGRLVGIRIWDDVQSRKSSSPTHGSQETLIDQMELSQ